MTRQFRTTLNILNVKMEVTFGNKGLPHGMMFRKDKTGTRYYTEDGRRFFNFGKAKKHQVSLDNRPKGRFS